MDCEFCHNTGIAECIYIDLHVSCEKCKGTRLKKEILSEKYHIKML